MQQKSKRLLALAIVLAAALTIYFLATAPLPPDRQQIAGEIQSAVASANDHHAGGVMAIVSATYRDNIITNTDQLRFLLNRGLRNSGSVSVQTDANTITVTGDSAQSVSHVTVNAGAGSPVFDGNIVLHWRREPAYRFLMFPATTWRVVSADYPNIGGMGDE